MAKRDKEALAAWKIAAQLEPLNVDVHANTAALLYRAGEFQRFVRGLPARSPFGAGRSDNFGGAGRGLRAPTDVPASNCGA